MDTEKFLKRVRADGYLAGQIRQTKIYKKVSAVDLNPKEKTELLFEVLNQLALYGNTDETVKFVDFAIEVAQTKLKQKTDSVAE